MDLCWAIVRLKSRETIAGVISEGEMAGMKVVIVETPEAGDSEAATRVLNPDAIFELQPCTEEQAYGALLALSQPKVNDQGSQWPPRRHTRTPARNGSGGNHHYRK